MSSLIFLNPSHTPLAMRVSASLTIATLVVMGSSAAALSLFIATWKRLQ